MRKVFDMVSGGISMLGGLRPYSRDVIRGCTQLAAVLYVFSALLYLLAPFSVDYYVTRAHADGLAAVAPLVIGIGVVVGLIADLVMRRGEERVDR
ncbi:MAG: hypothetical protein FWE80_06735 [Oscillospiraceae bacterium]|nr:hypothetical protein [Oscillospiraceae bacterium]